MTTLRLSCLSEEFVCAFLAELNHPALKVQGFVFWTKSPTPI
jgi:hypothetical protein